MSSFNYLEMSLNEPGGVRQSGSAVKGFLEREVA